MSKRIFLVAYADDEGSYAVAFSTRKAAETYAVNIEVDDERGPAKVIETVIDQHLDLVKDIINQVES